MRARSTCRWPGCTGGARRCRRWGICFTYGTWFGIRGLLAAGVPREDSSIQAACAFLLSIQHADGSWGESPQSCLQRHHVPSEEGKAVMTAWALLALVRAGHAHDPACERGVRFLLARQRPDGGFARAGYAGVFARTIMINYDCYRRYFPLWALSEWLDAQAGRPQPDADTDRGGSRDGVAP
jgi:squalene cyclase